MKLDNKIIAYALSDKSLAIKVVDKVSSKLLQPEFRTVLALISECVRKYNEVPTLVMMKRSNLWEENILEILEEAQKIREGDDFEPANFLLDLEDLKERYKKDLILKTGKEIFKENWDGSNFKDLKEAGKILKKAAANLDQVEANNAYREGTVAETAVEAKEEYIKRKENPELAKGIHTGIREFDRITNGLQPAELILVGGESSSGKSALVMNMAINAWLGSSKILPSGNFNFADDGVNVVYFTIEMPFSPFRRRFDACVSEVSLYGLRDGTLTPSDEEKYFNALEFQRMYSKQFHIVDIPRDCTVAQIEAKYLELMYDFVPQLIVVDYITLMKVGNDVSDSDWLGIGKVAEMLHEFCRAYNIPCISPVQLNRPKANNGDALPDQQRIGRSILLNQNCNILLNIQTRQNEDTMSDLIINIAKMRDGERGAFSLYKRFDMMKLLNDPEEDWFPEIDDEEN